MPFPDKSGKGVFIEKAVITKGFVMKYLLTGNEMAGADTRTSTIIGIPSIVLMERAALAVAQEMIDRYGE